MLTKEQITRVLDSLSQAELEQVGQYLAFLQYQSRLRSVPVVDESQLAALCAEFAEEDREMAEQDFADYAAALAEEDAR
jgi:hypothetical protein